MIYMYALLINLLTFGLFHLLFPCTISIWNVDITYFLKMFFIQTWFALIFLHINTSLYLQDKEDEIQNLKKNLSDVSKELIQTQDEHDILIDYIRSTVPAVIRFVKHVSEIIQVIYDILQIVLGTLIAICFAIGSVSFLISHFDDTNNPVILLVDHIEEPSIHLSKNSSVPESGSLINIDVDTLMAEFRKGQTVKAIAEKTIKLEQERIDKLLEQEQKNLERQALEEQEYIKRFPKKDKEKIAKLLKESEIPYASKKNKPK